MRENETPGLKAKKEIKLLMTCKKSKKPLKFQKNLTY